MYPKQPGKTNKAAGFTYFSDTELNTHWKCIKITAKTALEHVSIAFDTCHLLLLGGGSSDFIYETCTTAGFSAAKQLNCTVLS